MGCGISIHVPLRLLAHTRDLPTRVRMLRTGIITLLTFFSHLSGATGQDTAVFFREKCMGCHTIGGGRISGPDLKNVTQRREREWLIEFIMDPKSILDRGDPYATKLLEDSRGVVMPSLADLTRQRAEWLLDLIEAESQLEASQFKGVQVSTRPFTDADRAAGRSLFLGTTRLANGGTSCVSCHTVHGMSALGGGRLGPDLTGVYAVQGRKGLTQWLAAPATPTMLPIFKQHALTEAEINGLVAYLESLAGESPVQSSAARIAMLLMGLVGAAAVVFGFDAIWKRRFRGVRQPLVELSSKRGHR